MLIATVLVLIKSFLFLGVTGVKTPFGNAAGFVGLSGNTKPMLAIRFYWHYLSCHLSIPVIFEFCSQHGKQLFGFFVFQ